MRKRNSFNWFALVMFAMIAYRRQEIGESKGDERKITSRTCGIARHQQH